MNSEIKFPTLFGVGILVVGLFLGVFLVTQNQIFNSLAAKNVIPQKITPANLTDSTVSIYWQTDTPVTGFITYGTSKSLGQTTNDDRDTSLPQPYKLHFATLTNLNPNTTYFYKIDAGGSSFPEQPLTFKTLAPQTAGSYQPLIGTVLSSDKQPIAEAIVTLNIPGAEVLAAVTKTYGNFILPLAGIRTTDGTAFVFPGQDIAADLTVFDLTKSSRVRLPLPSILAKPLPSIILGQDLDISAPTSSPTTEPFQLDVNGDGIVNSVDSAIVYQNFGPLRQSESEARKNPKNPKADINEDGVVDQKDANLLIPLVPNISPKPTK